MKSTKNKKKNLENDLTLSNIKKVLAKFKDEREFELMADVYTLGRTDQFMIPSPYKAACHIGKCSQTKIGATLYMSIEDMQKHIKLDHDHEGG